MALVIRVGEIEAVWDGAHWTSENPEVSELLFDAHESHFRGAPPFVGYLPDPEMKFAMWLKATIPGIRIVEITGDVEDDESELPEGVFIEY